MSFLQSTQLEHKADLFCYNIEMAASSVSIMDYKESWALKNWCFWTVVLQKPLESPLDYKESQPVNPKGNQSWIITGKTDAEAETPILRPPDAKNSFEKTLMLVKIEGRRRRGQQRMRWLDGNWTTLVKSEPIDQVISVNFALYITVMKSKIWKEKTKLSN